MGLRQFVVAAASALLLISSQSVSAGQHHHATTAEHVDTSHFSTSCRPAVAKMFDRGVALLHSFWFGAAVDAFRLVAHSDVDCAMAYWGMALSDWGNPFEAVRPPGAIEAGQRAVASAAAARNATPRERRYIAAVAELYKDPEARDQRARVAAYRQAMASLSEAFPDDLEARVFYALALDQDTSSSSRTFASRLASAALLEPLFREQPEHPGIAHYLIHSYDDAALAPRGLDAARQFARIAPSTPYALHIPSHTFTRAGQWDESIDANLASADAARRDGSAAAELHALDYQVYALLQTGQDRAAAAIVNRVPAMGGSFVAGAPDSDATVGAYFALAAIPARYALERNDWASAAALQVRVTPFPWIDSLTYFARGLGAARTGHSREARSEVARLSAIEASLKGAGVEAVREQVDTLRRVVTAWILFADGRKREGVSLLRATANRKGNAIEMSTLSPGPLAPVRELLGEMLLEMNRPAEALAEFKEVLVSEPRRLRALLGAARAADRARQPTQAADHYRSIVEICHRADDPPRQAVLEARAYTQ